MGEIHTPTQDHQADMMDDAIAQAFVAARRKLDVEHHSRLVKAWELVVERAVQDNGDGSHTVKGVDQPEYLVDPSGCTCTDCTSGKAPKQLCKHILAVALEKRSRQKFQDMAEALTRPPVASEPLPEAPISICMKGTLGGVPGTLVTLRGHSMAEIEVRAGEVRAGARCLAGMFDADAPAPSAAAPAAQSAAPLCPDHQSEMKPSKFGGWYCPLPTGEGDTFCKRKVIAKKRAPFVPVVDGGMWREG